MEKPRMYERISVGMRSIADAQVLKLEGLSVRSSYREGV